MEGCGWGMGALPWPSHGSRPATCGWAQGNQALPTVKRWLVGCLEKPQFGLSSLAHGIGFRTQGLRQSHPPSWALASSSPCSALTTLRNTSQCPASISPRVTYHLPVFCLHYELCWQGISGLSTGRIYSVVCADIYQPIRLLDRLTSE